MDLYLGVDVGSESVRAVLIDATGAVVTSHSAPIKVFESDPLPSHFAEQSSVDIWHACCGASRGALQAVSGCDARERVRGMGFASTCSTLFVDDGGEALCISPTGLASHDIIMWKDHRATDQALAAAASCASDASPTRPLGPDPFWLTAERPVPKLLWLREKLSKTASKVHNIMDLSDWLVAKATGGLTAHARSLCALTAKFNYNHMDDKLWTPEPMPANGWPVNAYTSAGLSECVQDGFSNLGSFVQQPGAPVRGGLTSDAAEALGLNPSTPVGASLIDAHAGAIAVLGTGAPGVIEQPLVHGLFCSRAALICGTSTCLMVTKQDGPGCFVTPRGWLHETGQSAAGDLLHHIVHSHPAYSQLRSSESRDVFDQLNDHVRCMGGKEWPLLASDIHVLPEFRGSRELGDDTLRGMVCGLTLDTSLESLVKLYVAGILSLALGIKFIFENISRSDPSILPTVLVACGGVAQKNELYMQAHADALGIPVILASEPQAVALGAGMLGAAASGADGGLLAQMHRMASKGQLVQGTGCVDFMARKYRVYVAMLHDQKNYQQHMCSVSDRSNSIPHTSLGSS